MPTTTMRKRFPRWLAFPVGLLLFATLAVAVIYFFFVAHPARALASRDNAYLTTLAYSPDGQTIAAGNYGSKVYLWQASSGALRHTLELRARNINGLAFSPDGTTLAIATYYGVQLWQVSEGTLLRKFESGDDKALDMDEVLSVAYSPDGQILATGMESGLIHLRHSVDGTLLKTLAHPSHSTGVDRWVSALTFAPDGKSLAATILERNIVRIYRLIDGEIPRVLNPGDFLPGGNATSALAYSPDGKLIAVGTDSGDITVWPGGPNAAPDNPSDKPLRSWRAHKVELTGVAFSPDSGMLASSSRDLTVALSDPNSGGSLRSWQPGGIPLLLGSDAPIYGVAFSPDNRLLATASDDKVRLWAVHR